MASINDWAAKAAEEILTAKLPPGDKPRTERIAAIIAAHVPRCETCAHCVEKRGSFRPAAFLDCQQLNITVTLNFGCVQWKEKHS